MKFLGLLLLLCSVDTWAGWMLNDCEIIKAVGQDRHFILGMQGAVKAAGPFTYKNITQAKDALSEFRKVGHCVSTDLEEEMSIATRIEF